MAQGVPGKGVGGSKGPKIAGRTTYIRVEVVNALWMQCQGTFQLLI